MQPIPERERYQQLYAKGYPAGNPERLIVWAGAKLEEKVIDFGCGRGTLARIFSLYTGVDFASNAFPKRHGAEQSFVEANLDKLPDTIGSQRFDLGVCADVMEHIKPEEVDHTLISIMFTNCNRLLFAICCRESNWQDEKGQLHLTVERPEWWHKKLNQIGEARWRVTASKVFGATVYFELLRC